MVWKTNSGIQNWDWGCGTDSGLHLQDHKTSELVPCLQSSISQESPLCVDHLLFHSFLTSPHFIFNMFAVLFNPNT